MRFDKSTLKDLPFWVVMEKTSPDYKISQVETVQNGQGVSFLRFKAVLQTFDGKRNRNRRLWNGNMVKEALQADVIQEMLKAGGVPGEAGHPVPDSGEVSVERIATINPNNVSHFFKSFAWEKGNTLLTAIVETACDANGPGEKLKLRTLQGIVPAFSSRALIPQRMNKDGTIDQTGVGRWITADNVYGPSHAGAYADASFPLTEVTRNTKDLKFAVEACLGYSLETDKALEAIMEAYDIDPFNGKTSIAMDSFYNYNVKTEDGTSIIVPIRQNIKNDVKSYLRNLK